MSILNEIAHATKVRIEKVKAQVPLEELKSLALSSPNRPNFTTALQKPGLSVIAECKKASPSKGLIAPDFPYLAIAKAYEKAGADAVSVLTEPQYFKGCNDYLKEISQAITIPCLRKDFVVDPYMIYEAKVLGASAVLLIASLHTPKELEDNLNLCQDLGLSPLVEVHQKEEIAMVNDLNAPIIGINNRNLANFEVDLETTKKLRDLLSPNALFVAESGIHTRMDVLAMEAIGADAILVGESLMRAKDKTAQLRALKGLD
ncbi:indole-3-glycerol phosphate synthase TrpC [Atopobacter sp. AH10]|uniref:indole-3-glycerol phosphate synthase TrpC n=1 Tax=Atopobacter sp. AH10 TaxID=2315861 RepID=UPI000EF1F7EA|nr:indole-3-glycerol phosphate synthase TrpC [Atopobacter sp. AH10]RLK63441.1 indole-3-glycerol phosphate synthase TrpC [Atopobacter sp. AH10]